MTSLNVFKHEFPSIIVEIFPKTGSFIDLYLFL